jgi:Fe-Mn family superoxide dismutase
VLTYSPYDGRLYNQIAIDHSHAMVGAVPILVLDMYEHAYHLEFGANAAAYVDVFMRIVDWTVVAERFMGSTGDGRRHEAEPRKETLASISVEELQTIMQSEQHFQVVDARPRNYVSKDPDTMPNAVWRDPERVDEWSAQLSPDAPVFVYCAYGFEVGRSVTTTLRERGFDARYIRGGLSAWYGAGGTRAVRHRE